MKYYLTAALVLLFLPAINLSAQVRIAVLPFQNMQGNMNYNIICYNMQDSLFKAFEQRDSLHEYYTLVPNDSIEELLTELNIDPVNPQYPSDVWKVVKRLNIKKVLTGNFNFQAERILINAYIVDARTKLPNTEHQARDIFLPVESYYDAIIPIVEELLPALIPR